MIDGIDDIGWLFMALLISAGICAPADEDNGAGGAGALSSAGSSMAPELSEGAEVD